MTILITGGAGYIGSHAVLAFREAGERVVVIDDLSAGHREAVPEEVPFVEGDVADSDLVGRTLAAHGVEAVIHFAGSIIVPESVTDPLKYYRNNTAASRSLIESCVAAGVKRFVFSSTAAVYGMPQSVPIPERAPTLPINPYGQSKLMTETILADVAAAHDFRYLALRYFNVAGADPGRRAGQSSRVATHLIKIAAEVATGKRAGMKIYGEDYDTPDGTCIRDYVHVTDLAEAHVAALAHLRGGGGSEALNCGYGRGYSVREVLAEVEKAAGRPLQAEPAARRVGDAAELVADASLIRERLGWRPRHDDLGEIVASALAWERNLCEGSSQ